MITAFFSFLNGDLLEQVNTIWDKYTIKTGKNTKKNKQRHEIRKYRI